MTLPSLFLLAMAFLLIATEFAEKWLRAFTDELHWGKVSA